VGTCRQGSALIRACSSGWFFFTTAMLRALASSAVLVTVYYLLPLDHSSRWFAITMLVIGLVLLTGLVIIQVRWVATSRYPRLRAVEALAISVPLFLLLFASAYVVMATNAASSFSQPMTPHQHAVFHRHPVRHRRLRRYHRQDRSGPAAGHWADDHRFDHSQDRSQGHRGRDHPRPAAAGTRHRCLAERRRTRPVR
jgi:hypothetical protein